MNHRSSRGSNKMTWWHSIGTRSRGDYFRRVARMWDWERVKRNTGTSSGAWRRVLHRIRLIFAPFNSSAEDLLRCGVGFVNRRCMWCTEEILECLGRAWRYVWRWNLIRKHGFFWCLGQGQICLISMWKAWNFVMRNDWLNVMRNGVEVEGSKWLVRALGLWYHMENLNQ